MQTDRYTKNNAKSLETNMVKNKNRIYMILFIWLLTRINIDKKVLYNKQWNNNDLKTKMNTMQSFYYCFYV